MISVGYEETTERVFNFEVAGTHTYFAGDVGAWVHNAPFDSEQRALHDIIKDLLRKKKSYRKMMRTLF